MPREMEILRMLTHVNEQYIGGHRFRHYTQVLDFPYLIVYKHFFGVCVTKKCDKDEDSTVPKHIQRRDDGRSSNFYVRLVAPTDIQAFLPKKDHVFRKSLGTADLRRAKVIGAEIIARKLKEWAALREFDEMKPKVVQVLLNESIIKQIAGARLQSWLATDNRERWGAGGLDDEELATIEEFCKYSDGAMRSVLSQGAKSAKWGDVVESVLDWCTTLEYDVDVTDPEFPLLVRAFATAERTAQDFIAGRNRGDDPSEKTMNQPVGACLSVMNDEYIKYKSHSVGTKPVSMAISIWNRFILFKGDVFLDDVTSNDIFQFFEARLFTDEGKKWSQGYVNGHATRLLKEIFALARTKSLMSGPNPVANLEMTPKLSERERRERMRPRFAYSGKQINILFSSEWYIPSSKYFRGKVGTDLAVRFFGPLIGLLHGTRVREFLQLVTGDIFVADGILCFKFQVEFDSKNIDESEIDLKIEGTLVVGSRNDKSSQTKTIPLDSKKEISAFPERTVKNASVLRTIPVHPKLIALGFGEFVKVRREQSGVAAPLFESSVPAPGGKAPMWGRAYEQAFLRYVRDTLGFGSGFGSHSFRHQFEDRIKNAQARTGLWPAGLAQLMSGRNLPKDADRQFFREIGSEIGYGNGYHPSAALPFIERLDFSDIVFPLDFATWSK